MANTPSKPIMVLFTILILCSSNAVTSQSESTFKLGLQKCKLTQFQVYSHTSGDNSTLVEVAEAATTNTSSTSFGEVRVVDLLLTESPELNSTHLGRAQGLFISTSVSDATLLLVVTYVFTDGKYNGSSLSVLGRNPFSTETVRELPVVGGTGLFRFATGYAEQTTYTGSETNDFIYEYNFYVLHY